MRPYRKERLGSLIRQLVSEVLARHLQDPRISAFTTVTRVEVSRDLQMAKVYLSVLNETDDRKTLAALGHATGHVQGLVARDLHIRQCPQLHFLVDPRVRGTRHTLELLEQNRRAKPEAFLPETAGAKRQAGEEGPAEVEPRDEEHPPDAGDTDAEADESDDPESPDADPPGGAEA